MPLFGRDKYFFHAISLLFGQRADAHAEKSRFDLDLNRVADFDFAAVLLGQVDPRIDSRAFPRGHADSVRTVVKRNSDIVVRLDNDRVDIMYAAGERVVERHGAAHY